MLLTQGETRGFRTDRRLATSLAAIAGTVNAAGFQSFGLFSANMTGNVLMGSVRLARGEMWGAALFAGIVFAFIAGAATATLVIGAGVRRGVRSIYALGILGEAIFLGLLAGTVLLLPTLGRPGLLIPGLSFLMGLQNAVVTRISLGRVRTTHVSGMATDLGIEMGVLLEAAFRRLAGDELAICRAKIRLQAQTIIAFATGGVLGVWLYDLIGLRLLLCDAGILALLALPAVRPSIAPADR